MTHRNDPCPCGSGRKYKHCCMGRAEDRSAPDRSMALPPAVIAAAQERRAWELDVFPVPATVRSEGDALLSAALVVAGGHVLAANAKAALVPEAEAVAVELAATLRKAVSSAGAWPRTVCVRHPQLVAPLQRLLTDAPVVVRLRVPLVDLPEARSGLLAEFYGRRTSEPLPVVVPETFAGWSLPEDVTARLFAAAADYWRLAPWRHVANNQVLHARMADGRNVACVVLGNAGIQRGLSMYSDEADLSTLASLREPGTFDRLVGSVVTMTFDRPGEVPAAYRREVRKAGWELAQADALPRVMTINTLAGGLSQEAARDFVILLGAIPRFIVEHDALLSGEVAVTAWPCWVDLESGVTICYRGYARLEPPGPWPPVAQLVPALAEGPGARPAAALEADDVGDGLDVDLQAFGALLERTAAEFGEYLEATDPEGADSHSRHVFHAVHFLAFLRLDQGVPIEAVTEYDLRTYLFERSIVRGTDGDALTMELLPDSLERFLAFLEQRKLIRCPWASAVLSERGTYEERGRKYPGDSDRVDDTDSWHRVLAADLQSRVFLPDERLAPMEDWEPTGPIAARLDTRLRRLWLIWRDEVIRAGTRDPELARSALLARQRAWERTAQPELDGRSPLEAVLEERETPTSRAARWFGRRGGGRRPKRRSGNRGM